MELYKQPTRASYDLPYFTGENVYFIHIYYRFSIYEDSM